MTPQSPLAGSGGFGASYAAGAQQFQATVDVLKADHLKAARSSVRDPELLKELEGEIERDCEGLRSFLFAAQVWVFYYYRCCWIYTLVDWVDEKLTWFRFWDRLLMRFHHVLGIVLLE